jgi:hypothetical protein
MVRYVVLGSLVSSCFGLLAVGGTYRDMFGHVWRISLVFV